MRFVLIGAAALVATILGLTLSVLVFGPPTHGTRAGVVEGSGTALIGGPFELVDQTGATVTEDILIGRPTLVYFGFTYCPDFCPMELANMAATAEMLDAQGVDIGMVFVTIDPERDTPEILKEYVEAFDERIIGLSGTPEQVAAAAKAYRVVYRKAEGPDFPDGYTMDHSTFLYAMDPDGQFMTHFAAATPPNEIATTILGRL